MTRITLSALAQGLYEQEQEGGMVRRIWDLVAFLGRYAHQPAGECMRMTVGDMQALADATGRWLSREHAAGPQSPE